MNEPSKYKASCFCGAVELSLNGEPEVMAYCHCQSCRQWSAGPVNAFSLWQPAAVQITKGINKLAGFSRNPGSQDETVVSKRMWCKECGGHLLIEHPTMQLIDVPAVVIQNMKFNPAFHVHYQEHVHGMPDGLPKFKDLPKEAGGSGETVME